MSYNRVDPIRVHGVALGAKRDRLLDYLSSATDELREIDRQLDDLARQRRQVAAHIHQARHSLWPNRSKRGRKPAPDGTERLKPAPAGAIALWGRRLRAACRAILSTHDGALDLPELHARLHDRGNVVKSLHPVKALADAMAYEVEIGRARRVERGVYQLLA